MDKYLGFKKQIPENIMENVEKCLSNEIALFKPNTFITGKLMYSEDFHLIIPSVAPPDTYVNNKLQSFSSKKIVIFNQGDTILCTEGGVKKQYLSLLIKPEFINKIAEEMELGNPGAIRFEKLQNPYSRELIQAINAFDREAARGDSFPLMLDCIAVQIVTFILREFKTNLKKAPINSPDMDINIKLSVEYIHTYYNSNITITDICEEINVSPFHFIRSFKEKMGISPHQYLIQLRIQKAKELLKCRSYSISEVAMLCGFVNLSHFSSTFKDITGYSPNRYKKSI